MNASERVARARTVLLVAAIANAVLWGAAAALAAAALTRFLALFTVLSPFRFASMAAGVVSAIALWRTRFAWSREAVAIWLEERAPDLHFALVTAAEQPASPSATDLDRVVAGVPLAALVAGRLGRTLAWPIGALAAASVLLLLAPAASHVRGVIAPLVGGTSGARAATAEANRLAPLTGSVTPPAYSGLPSRMLADPLGIAALVASRVELRGPGAAAGILAKRGDSALTVESDGAHWRVRFAMPATAMALRLNDGSHDRLIVLEPRPDSAPVVTLLAPARDTVLRVGAGTIALAAEARDDFGLDAGWLEYIVSSGEGESFTFRSGVLGRVDAAGERAAPLSAALRLESLALKPGDLVHVRAVARDRNDATGPDTGVSETRTIRVARQGEYDSIAVEGAPPPDADKSVISERMLIMLAEDLQRRRPKLAHETLANESIRIARDQAKLRKQVSRVIFARLGQEAESEGSQALDDSAPPKTPEEMLAAADRATNVGTNALDFAGDETPVVAVNRTLLEAYNAMWDAERRLQVAEPGDALPYMRAALAAIQRARAAERLYLRGRPPVAVVDLAKVRLAGKRDDAAGTDRHPRAALDSSAARRTMRLDAALRLLASNPGAAVDSLLLLRVDAIAQDPALATALGVAIDSLRAGHDATAPLARARRIAAGAPAATQDGSRWDGAW